MNRFSVFVICFWQFVGVGHSHAALTPITISIRIRIAQCGPASVTSQAVTLKWAKTHVDAANQLFAPLAIQLDATYEFYAAQRCDAITATDRDTYAKDVAPKGITVLVVSRVQDIDVPDYDLMGVHWRYRGAQSDLKGRRWVFLTTRATPGVLAHELGHYFGLPHDPRGGNIMTPGPSSPAWKLSPEKRPKPYQPHFSAAQAHKLRRILRTFR